MDGLTNKQENLIRALQTRHGRRDSAYCLCDGLRASGEILALRSDLVELLLLREDVRFDVPAALRDRTRILSEREFAKLACTVNSQGILTVAARPPAVAALAPCPDPFVLILDRVRDPGNFGTILRTARAVGLKEVWLTKGSADPFSDKILRSASGAQFALGLRYADTLDDLALQLTALGYPTVFRTEVTQGESVFQTEALFNRSAIVLGCEATGAALLKGSRPLHIPMPGGTESLNVAQAATVILFEYVRRFSAGPA